MTEPLCPLCRSRGDRQLDGTYRCRQCDAWYDGTDDGDVGYGDPARIAARNERREQQQQQQRRTRR
ncbi:MAG: hypothetical protein ACE15C_20075 [Phycisphaerae bacterium]